eukprot:TRINITY_DN12698_c0_g1_i15.p1 TRINITY_DN12698_c0_g1~~TRINITY_DN12698_c0_g1_i15.p1  ORF type:complete len:169 (-),score=8.69 TRINITY_DN12698_c0_g1_i15:315-821(-)
MKPTSFNDLSCITVASTTDTVSISITDLRVKYVRTIIKRSDDEDVHIDSFHKVPSIILTDRKSKGINLYNQRSLKSVKLIRFQYVITKNKIMCTKRIIFFMEHSNRLHSINPLTGLSSSSESDLMHNHEILHHDARAKYTLTFLSRGAGQSTSTTLRILATQLGPSKK